MNQLVNFEFSEFSLLTVLILGVLLAVILSLIRRTVIAKVKKNRNKQIYQIVELFFWVAYGLWALHIVLKDSLYYMIAVLSISAVITIWLGWFVARDFIAGIVLKFTDNFQPGQRFRLNEISGTVLQTDFLQLSVRQQDGVTVKIPYNKIIGEIHSKARAEDKATQHRFQIQSRKESSIEDVQDKIRQAILLSTGVSINKEPQIILKEVSDNKYIFDVSAPVMDEDYFELVERNVKMAVNSTEL